MTRSIKYRLFLSMLAATVIVVVGMVLIMRWNINRGFLQYLKTVEQTQLQRLSGLLEQGYSEYGSWDFVRDNPQLRHEILREAHHHGPAPPLVRLQLNRLRNRLKHPSGQVPSPPEVPPPRRHRHHFDSRVVLLDAAQHPVFGPSEELGRLPLKPLEVDGKVVGYLGLLPLRHLSDTHQVRFLKEQGVALLLVAGLMALVTILLSLPLANRLLRPLKDLATATHRLAAGDHTIRVPVTSTDELGRLARDFNALALSLEKNELARRQWIADISHELRTPLSVLRGEIEALQDGIRPVSTETLSSLHGEALHLGRLVEDLYQLALSDLGALTYRKEETDLAEVMGDCLDGFSAALAKKGVALISDLGTEMVPVFADAARLQQLFDNLMKNALCYTDAGGRLEVRLSVDGTQAAVDLNDS
ncbi:MAG TPA: HAMP domain-containing protein, partial [Desulfuromonadales bacterium]|nr:HAMP domain-containing protein [Desulfuromonadales bacterium]